MSHEIRRETPLASYPHKLRDGQNAPVCADVSSITINCKQGSDSHGFDQLTCDGFFVADIRTPITSGQIDVWSDVLESESLRQTINVLPNTTPRQMTIQFLPHTYAFTNKGACAGDVEVNMVDRVGHTGPGRSIYGDYADTPVKWNCS